VAILSGSAAACDPVVQPSLDPGAYVLSGVQFACQQWLPNAPSVQLGLFDIYWGRPAPGLDDDGPTDEHRQLVRASGGVVVHEFHVRMIRAVLPPGKVPDLTATVVRGVPLAHDYPVDLFVRFSGAINEDVIAWIESSGGRILNRFENIATVAAVVSDARIPTLRDLPDVADVAGIGLVCAESRGLPPS
jgi:hypothetical protein